MSDTEREPIPTEGPEQDEDTAESLEEYDETGPAVDERTQPAE